MLNDVAFFIYNCCKDNFYFSDYTTFYPTFFVDLTIYLFSLVLLPVHPPSDPLQYSFLLLQPCQLLWSFTRALCLVIKQIKLDLGSSE